MLRAKWKNSIKQYYFVPQRLIQFFVYFMSKVLILGGYGNFGKYIANTLLKQNIPIILAGRRPFQLQKAKSSFSQQYKNQQIDTAVIDVNKDNIQKLHKLKPNVVINTCGPFQNANYKIVEDCISSKVNYIDLADGRQFVNGMSAYHQNAVNQNVTVITGASSVPGLSSAVIEEYRSQFKQIDSIVYGISPGQRTNRGGQATVKGVMGYLGKPIKPFGDLKQPIYGWQDLYYQKYPELGTRLFGNCQVPDLDIFPSKYGVKNIRFSAGVQNKFLHLGIFLTSWLIRIGVPLDLAKYSNFLLNASHTLFDPLGTDEGGMHMNIMGINKQNKPLILRWFIIVRKGHGPNVPVIPAIILCRKMYKQKYSLPGVHSCAGLVTLTEYLNELKDFSFQTYVDRQILQK